ncbi:HypC/HybG/HupF family hydrogenase formation chaperone [Maritimibacter dapengensis]|uniref:HypC/HybG/HupF family hydrogenase formation chaperone n=1 Tax=Maritimibacter dapengensis TaxID=2836868 RepID=A0ABS6T680_9RHOB|nr:HypC/HybG/HupF family hydrogenase formation chaperone [Maritimibacter dapengensis]MBV7380769.1 HypC/HybG/HupF family hydrogenase formation chaperone [Maritimibacter dapengensis]
MCLGIPGQIVEITDESRLMAMADVSGVRREVSIAPVLGAGMTPGDLIGEYALIHVGFAMAIIDEQEAAETLKALEGLGEAQETLEAMAEGAKALEERA